MSPSIRVATALTLLVFIMASVITAFSSQPDTSLSVVAVPGYYAPKDTGSDGVYLVASRNSDGTLNISLYSLNGTLLGVYSRVCTVEPGPGYYAVIRAVNLTYRPYSPSTLHIIGEKKVEIYRVNGESIVLLNEIDLGKDLIGERYIQKEWRDYNKFSWCVKVFAHWAGNTLVVAELNETSPLPGTIDIYTFNVSTGVSRNWSVDTGEYYIGEVVPITGDSLAVFSSQDTLIIGPEGIKASLDVGFDISHGTMIVPLVVNGTRALLVSCGDKVYIITPRNFSKISSIYIENGIALDEKPSSLGPANLVEFRNYIYYVYPECGCAKRFSEFYGEYYLAPNPEATLLGAWMSREAYIVKPGPPTVMRGVSLPRELPNGTLLPYYLDHARLIAYPWPFESLLAAWDRSETPYPRIPVIVDMRDHISSQSYAGGTLKYEWSSLVVAGEVVLPSDFSNGRLRTNGGLLALSDGNTILLYDTNLNRIAEISKPASTRLVGVGSEGAVYLLGENGMLIASSPPYDDVDELGQIIPSILLDDITWFSTDAIGPVLAISTWVGVLVEVKDGLVYYISGIPSGLPVVEDGTVLRFNMTSQRGEQARVIEAYDPVTNTVRWSVRSPELYDLYPAGDYFYLPSRDAFLYIDPDNSSLTLYPLPFHPLFYHSGTINHKPAALLYERNTWILAVLHTSGGVNTIKLYTLEKPDSWSQIPDARVTPNGVFLIVKDGDSWKLVKLVPQEGGE